MAYRKTQLGRGYNSQAAGSRHEEVNLRLSNLAKLPAGQLWRTIASAYMFTKFVFHIKFEGHTIHNRKTNAGRTDRCELRLRGKAGGWAEFWQGTFEGSPGCSFRSRCICGARNMETIYRPPLRIQHGSASAVPEDHD